MPILTLPNGRQVEVPVLPPPGTPQEEVAAKLISKGLAKPEEFTKPTALQKIAGGIEAGANIISSALAEPVAGIAGTLAAATPFAGGADTGADVVRYIREQGTYQPKTQQGQRYLQDIAGGIVGDIGQAYQGAVQGAGDVTYDVTGSPALGAITQAATSGAIDYLTGKTAGLAGRGIQKLTGGKQLQPGKIITTQNGELVPVLPQQNANIPDVSRIIEEATPQQLRPLSSQAEAPQIATREQISNVAETAVGKNAAEEIIPQVNVDTLRAKAAQEEGMQLTPGALSNDPAFIEYQAAISSKPGAKIKIQQQENILELGKAVDDLRNSIAGTIDVGAVDARVVDKFNSAVTRIRAKEKRVFDSINSQMADKGNFAPNNTMALINSEANAVGGLDKLKSSKPGLYKLYEDIQDPKNEGFTYQYIDSIRRQIGSGYERKGSFKDFTDSELDAMYGALAQDQKAFIESVDPVLGKKYAAINKATQIRKQLEDDAKSFKPIISDDKKTLISAMYVAKIGSAMREATSGNPQAFNQLIAKVPKKSRPEVVATALDSFISAKRIKEGSVTGTFADVGEALNRNATAKKAIYSTLPESAQKRLDNLFLIAQGVFNLEKRMNKSLTARDVILSQQAQLDATNKLYGKIAKMAGGAAGSKTGSAVAGATVAENIAETLLNKSSVAAKADDLLSSPGFQKSLNDFAMDNVQKAEKTIKSTPEYKRWIKEQNQNTINMIERIGFFSWLMPSQSQELNQPTSMIDQAKAVERKTMLDESMKNMEQKSADMAGIYNVDQDRKLAIDMQTVASKPKYVGMAMLHDLYDGDQSKIKVAESFIKVAMTKPEYRPVLVSVKNILKNSNIIPPDNKQEEINRMIGMGIKPQKAVTIANMIKQPNPKEARKMIDSIKGKLTPDMYSDFAPLINSLEAFT